MKYCCIVALLVAYQAHAELPCYEAVTSTVTFAADRPSRAIMLNETGVTCDADLYIAPFGMGGVLIKNSKHPRVISNVETELWWIFSSEISRRQRWVVEFRCSPDVDLFYRVRFK